MISHYMAPLHDICDIFTTYVHAQTADAHLDASTLNILAKAFPICVHPMRAKKLYSGNG